MASTSRPWRGLLAGLLTLWLCQAALADPPGRVGRLADLQGPVWLYDSDTAQWVAASRNRPLTSGDRLSTDAGARAELRVGSSTLRLDAGTEVEILQLDDDIVRVQLHNGLLALRLRTHEAAKEFELLTAEGRFKPDRAGRYRLDRVDATSSITVWSGQMLFEAPDNAVMLVTGQRADIWNNGRTQYTLVAPRRDAFADEVAAGELSEERSVSARYVSPEMTGAEDLDRHGRWETDPDYGALWVPEAVVPGWAPYRFGQWAWVRPWGWTWVDDAPWGFAPFHYGRWIYRRNAWCWAPGRWIARPVYAPALVAWVGSPRSGGSASAGASPTVGWFPLGPREVFVPAYRTSPHYVRNVNLSHVTNVANAQLIVDNPDMAVGQMNYVHRGQPGAVTIVPAGVVSGRQPVAAARVHLTDPRPAGGREAAAWVSASAVAGPPLHGAVPVQPGAAFGRRDATVGATQPAVAPLPATATPPAQSAPSRGPVPPPPVTPMPSRGRHIAPDVPLSPSGVEIGARSAPPPAAASPRPVRVPTQEAPPTLVQPPPPLPGQPGTGTTMPTVVPRPIAPQPAAPATAPVPVPVPVPRSGPAAQPVPPANTPRPAAATPNPAVAPPTPAGAAAPTPPPAMHPPAATATAPAPAPVPAPRTREQGDEPRQGGKAEK